MFVPNFIILSQVVSEKSLTEKKLTNTHAHKHINRKGKNYIPPIYFVCGGYKKIRGMTDFSCQFRKIIMCYKRICYNLNAMRQSACLVINPITVDGYAALFNCTPVDGASDSMMAPT